MPTELHFLGAARYTTGTKHLVVANGRRILLDCGLVQGPRKVAEQANRRLPVEPRTLDSVVLSHAHIDHSGALPTLIKHGYAGHIWCTRATRDLVAVMLRDAARIQLSDAAFLNKQRGGEQPIEPLYDERDVDRCIRQLRPIEYRQSTEILPGVKVFLRDAGHILGSANVELQIQDGGQLVRIGFTGDHGRRGKPILKDPEKFEALDYLITESTYGDRRHPPEADLELALEQIIREENRDGGRILIPAFAVGRVQALVYALGRLRAASRIPAMPIFVDSPLALAATKVIAAHPECYDEEIARELRAGHDPFYFDGVRYIESVDESKELNAIRSPHIVIAASGMCESGRVLHHLKHSAGRAQDCLLFVGFQAEGTLGRRLLEGAREARIYGQTYSFNMRVRKLNGFSAHADADELLWHLRHLAGTTKTVFVVHGEETPALAFAERLRGAGFHDVRVPVRGEKVTL